MFLNALQSLSPEGISMIWLCHRVVEWDHRGHFHHGGALDKRRRILTILCLTPVKKFDQLRLASKFIILHGLCIYFVYITVSKVSSLRIQLFRQFTHTQKPIQVVCGEGMQYVWGCNVFCILFCAFLPTQKAR